MPGRFKRSPSLQAFHIADFTRGEINGGLLEMPISRGDAELDRARSLDAYPFELFFWEAGLVIAAHLAIALLANLLLL